ncbi:MAG: diacylglycerol kinase family lipid kinase [Gemmatimonadetes bacterium]|nr:diacylglycerol kinase family lipid kinase [Gemmatimonadota bacterium]
MTRALIITNPAAARTRPESVEVVERVLRAGGWDVRVLATGGSGDARRLAEEAVRERADVVGVFGGDGTTMQAAAALVGSTTALGVLPGGTGNLRAGNLRIPTDPRRAAEALLLGVRRPFDLGKVVRADGVHYFAVAAGAGVDAQVMAETASAEKRRWGMGAYLATTLRLLPEIRSKLYHITVDGREYEMRASLLVVANCAEVIPPFLKFRQGTAPDDGLFDVVAIRADTLGESARALWQFVRETDRTDPKGSLVGHARGKVVTIATDPILPMQLDGDLAGTTPFTAEVVPGAIQVLAPPRSLA